MVVFRPGALGDTILSIQAIAALRERFPGAYVELVGNAAAGELLKRNGTVDSVTSFESPRVTELFMTPPRVAAWTGAACIVLWLRQCEQLAESFRDGGVPVILCADPEPADAHIADHLVATLAPLGVKHRRLPARKALATLETLRGPGDATPSPPQRLLIHPGSGSIRKNWPPERFAGLAIAWRSRHGGDVALLKGPADGGPVEAMARLVRRSGLALTTIEPKNLPDLADCLAAAAGLVGNDSGVCHLSAALGTRTVAIFGATDPARWAPQGPRVMVLGEQGAWPTVNDVLAAVERLLFSDQEHSRAQDESNNEGHTIHESHRP